MSSVFCLYDLSHIKCKNGSSISFIMNIGVSFTPLYHRGLNQVKTVKSELAWLRQEFARHEAGPEIESHTVVYAYIIADTKAH